MMILSLTGTVQAANLTWDADTGTSGAQDGTGNWVGNNWWNGSANATWNNSTPDNATIGNGGNGGTITLGTVTAGTVTFTNYSGTYTLSSGTLTQSGGITVAANAGDISISSTIDGTGGLTINGTSYLVLRTATLSYTGTTTINGGETLFQSNYSPGNLTLNGGILVDYWGGNFTRSLGTGAGQFQITGGTSGFCGQGTTGLSVAINNNASYEVVWGSAYFNPSTLVLQSPKANEGGNVNFQNKIDLNGSTRTILQNKNPGSTSGKATMSGVIRNSNGTAGIIKSGPGPLILSANNTFNGPVSISQGTLSINSINTVANPNPLGQSPADAANLLLGNGTILLYTGGAASCDRAFTINGTADGHSATLETTGSGALVLTGKASPAYGTANQTRKLILTGTSTYTNTLFACIADNGSGAVSVFKTGTGLWVMAGTNTYSGATIVTNGTLRITHAKVLALPTSLYLYSGSTTGRIDLAFSGTQNITSLFINGEEQKAGLHVDNGITITGTGRLKVGILGTVLMVR